MFVAPQMSLEAISAHLIRELAKKRTPEYTDPLTLTVKTQAVKDILGDLGKNQLKHLVCCNGWESKDQGEWLLDLVWMDSQSWAIILAVESEWGDIVKIKEDFGKLLCIKAAQKIMLVAHKHTDGIRSVLSEMIRAYPWHLSGEEYLLMECTDVEVHRYLFRVSADGPTTLAEWEKLPVLHRTALASQS